ncbi:hypothetical protein [Pseudomonas sp.]|uniref:hypothetical protein n=1 Tax=Pseudomonas sp. TaxID=306 RepID=UPI0028AE45E6|nr:hypothetical protein [Pseudomonas sp.]
MSVGSYGHELSRRNLLSQCEHYKLSEQEALALIDEVAGWEPDLVAHYRHHLGKPELSVALEAMGAEKLRR